MTTKEQEPMNPVVVILTPCFGGTCTIGYTQSLLATMNVLALHGMCAHVLFCANDYLVPRARNLLLAEAYERYEDATHFFFVDADMVWSPHDVLKLLAHRLPVVAGAYPIQRYHWPKEQEQEQKGEEGKQSESLPTSLLRYNLRYTTNPADGIAVTDTGLVEVVHVGTGFLLLARETIAAMRAAYPETRYIDNTGYKTGEVYALFDCAIVQGQYLSEDYLFCHRWLLLSSTHRVYVDVTVALTHIGPESFEGRLLSRVHKKQEQGEKQKEEQGEQQKEEQGVEQGEKEEQKE